MLLQADTIDAAKRIAELGTMGVMALVILFLIGALIYIYKEKRDMQAKEVERAELRTAQMIEVATEARNAFENLSATNTEMVQILRELKFKN